MSQNLQTACAMGVVSKHADNKMAVQLNSFEAELPVPAIATQEGGAETCRAVFIRAPAILSAVSSVELLAEYPLSPSETVDAPGDSFLHFHQSCAKFRLCLFQFESCNKWMFASELTIYGAETGMCVPSLRASASAVCNGGHCCGCLCSSRKEVARTRLLSQ